MNNEPHSIDETPNALGGLWEFENEIAHVAAATLIKHNGVPCYGIMSYKLEATVTGQTVLTLVFVPERLKVGVVPDEIVPTIDPVDVVTATGKRLVVAPKSDGSFDVTTTDDRTFNVAANTPYGRKLAALVAAV